MRGSGAFCDVPAVYMSFCREYWFWRFWAFACASGCFVAWRLVLRWYVSFMPLFARFVRGFRCFSSFICHFIVVWRSPALRLLCAAVSVLCPVFDGGLRFYISVFLSLFFLRQFFFIFDVRFYTFFCR